MAEKCHWCGTKAMLSETYDGDLLCPSCYELYYGITEAEDDGYCEICQEPIEEDPYCPICNRNLCESCYEKHLPGCSRLNELGESQRFITEWI